jgi:phenylalanyl-tRNA synthetase alpha chain
MGAGNKAEAVSDEAPREVMIATEVFAKAVGETVDESDLSDEERSFVAKNSKKRGAAASPFKIIEREEVFYRLTDEGAKAKAALFAATHHRRGAWRCHYRDACERILERGSSGHTVSTRLPPA